MDETLADRECLELADDSGQAGSESVGIFTNSYVQMNVCDSLMPRR